MTKTEVAGSPSTKGLRPGGRVRHPTQARQSNLWEEGTPLETGVGGELARGRSKRIALSIETQNLAECDEPSGWCGKRPVAETHPA